MMSDEPLKIETRGRTLWVTLNRPERLNAMNEAMVEALNALFDDLRGRHDIRTVVLRGAGKNFCAGLDLQAEGSRGEGRMDVSTGLLYQHKVARIAIGMRRCPQPIICLIDGAAAGGGFAMALASDVRIASPTARMNAAFIRIGLSACDVGVSYFLPRMVGSSVAAEYLLTGRFMNAQRALGLGLFSQVAPLAELQAEAQALADDMLRTTLLGLRLTKEGLGHAIDAGSLEAVIAMEDRQQVLCTQSGDFREGMAAFLEKRAPVYRNT
jgi:enoyl-CoA hydratase/carnithine racemase